MHDMRLKKLAEQVVTYSLGVKKGDNVMINGTGYSCSPFVDELIEAVLNAGGIPHPVMKNPSHSRLFLLGMDEERLNSYTKIYEDFMGKMDCYISISAGITSSSFLTYLLHR